MSGDFDTDEWKLVFRDSGQPVNEGMEVRNFRGEWAIVEHAEPPHKPSSTGRVHTSLGLHYPSVYNMEWVRK